MNLVEDIYNYMEEKAPFASALSYDNVGLLVGGMKQEISTVLLALDITSMVVEEAKQQGAQLIISHHPVIFQPLRQLGTDSVPYCLAACGISALCCHTNLDLAVGGVNECLALCLGLEKPRPLSEKVPEVLIGSLPVGETTEQLALRVKKALTCGPLRVVDSGRTIHRVAVCCGAGGEYAAEAARQADAFVTGEMKHHELLLAQENRLTAVIAGHFETENPIIGKLKNELELEFPTVRFIKSEMARNPVCYF